MLFKVGHKGVCSVNQARASFCVAGNTLSVWPHPPPPKALPTGNISSGNSTLNTAKDGCWAAVWWFLQRQMCTHHQVSSTVSTNSPWCSPYRWEYLTLETQVGCTFCHLIADHTFLKTFYCSKIQRHLSKILRPTQGPDKCHHVYFLESGLRDRIKGKISPVSNQVYWKWSNEAITLCTKCFFSGCMRHNHLACCNYLTFACHMPVLLVVSDVILQTTKITNLGIVGWLGSLWLWGANTGKPMLFKSIVSIYLEVQFPSLEMFESF